MIQSRPKLKGKKLIVISLMLIILTVLLFPTAQFAGTYAAVVQVCAIASAAASIFILIKYVIPDYLYTLENGHLTIHKVTKAQSICVADFEISTATTKLLTLDEYKRETKQRKVFTFVKNPFCEDIRYLAFSPDGADITIQFEPDEFFRNELEHQLENINNEEDIYD